MKVIINAVVLLSVLLVWSALPVAAVAASLHYEWAWWMTGAATIGAALLSFPIAFLYMMALAAVVNRAKFVRGFKGETSCACCSTTH